MKKISAWKERLTAHLKKAKIAWEPRQQKLIVWWKPQQEKLLLWIKPRQEKALNYWQNMSQHEKYTAMGCSGLVVFFILYVCLWSPILSQVTTLRKQINHEKKTALWMIETDKKIRFLENKKSTATTKNLALQLNALQEKIQQAPLSKNLTQLTQVGADEIHCSFETVDFDKLITWLIDFSQQESFTIEQASIKRIKAVGMVQAEFVLKVG